MGNSVSTKKVNFEDIQYLFKNTKPYLLINTLNSNEQDILIKNTISINKEEKIINDMLYKNIEITIIVYDKNANAPNLMTKYTQLVNLGFSNVYIYPGGLFEWLCLQDIYSFDNFPTTKNDIVVDILKFKGKSVFNTFLLSDSYDLD
jgi:hypothetical protein